MASNEQRETGVRAPALTKVLMATGFAALLGLGVLNALARQPDRPPSPIRLLDLRLKQISSLAPNPPPFHAFHLLAMSPPIQPATPFINPRVQAVYDRSCQRFSPLCVLERGNEPWAPHHHMFDALAVAGLVVGFQSRRNARAEYLRQRAST